MWLEVRCQRQNDGCWSWGDSGPSGLSLDTNKDIQKILSMLNKEAANQGWKKIRGEGWVCPACKTK